MTEDILKTQTGLGKKIIFFVTDDWYFCSHRLPLAVAAKEAGYDVAIATRIQNHGDKIRQHGLRIIPLNLRRRSKNPFAGLVWWWTIRRIYKKERPDIVHHVAIRPVFYGGLATYFNKRIKVVNAIAGLGFVFTSNSLLAKILKPLIRFSLKRILSRRQSLTIVQNPDDAAMLTDRLKLDKDRVSLIKGAGVNLDVYRHSPEPGGPVSIGLVSRMLWAKGIGEFVKAVALLKNQGYEFRAILAGTPDPENPSSIPEVTLREWHDGSTIEYKGHVEDIPALWAESNIAILPSSYGEGIPKCLIEAAACGKPIIATDTPGCREIVKNGVNGILVAPKNVEALSSAIKTLLDNKDLRNKMGAEGRRMVENEFSESIVIQATLQCYARLLNE